jgi:hypothetical protein
MKCYYTKTKNIFHHFVIKFEEPTCKTPFKFYLRITDPHKWVTVWSLNFQITNISHTCIYDIVSFDNHDLSTIFKHYNHWITQGDLIQPNFYPMIENKTLYNSLINTMKHKVVQIFGV